MNKNDLTAETPPLVTVLMPCLNEAETLADCIEEAWEGLRNAGLDGEVVVADNGSVDGSQEIARVHGARVVHVAEKGYGHALREGMTAARGRYILMGDSDKSYDFREVGTFVSRLQAGADVVMGCRMPAGGGRIERGAMPWKHRWIGNPALTFIGRLFFRCPVHDFHCGLRALTKEAFERMDLRTGGMEFASEMVIKASMCGLRVEEVPVVLRKDGRSKPPHLRSWRDGWRHLRFMLLFSPRWLLLYPGVAAFLLGGGIFLRLLAGPIQVGRVSFDLNSLEIAGMVVLFGYQMILFGCFARIFAFTRGLLPRNHILSRAFGFFTLEKGLVAGLLILLAGVVILLSAVFGWAREGFGNLNPLESTRTVIAGRTLASIGIQTILFSLIFSYLGLNERPSSSTGDREMSGSA